jgi:hypothetical protein
VPPEWLAAVRDYWDRSGKTLKAIGIELALQMGRAQPVRPNSVHEYITGTATTEEMTRAFAHLMGVAPPILGVDDPEVVAWCEVGRRLKSHTSEIFRDELARLTELVESMERLRGRRH